MAKPRSSFETVNDLDEDLITFWRVLRERGPELARLCALTPHSRVEHAASFDLAGVDELERARRVWVRLSQGRGALIRRTGWRYFRDASRRVGSMPETLNAYVDRMWPAIERIAGVSLECRPALEVVRDYGQHPNVLLYVDPPYLASTRSPGNQYRHEMRTDSEHVELAEALHRCRARVVLSGYPSALYDDLYAEWTRYQIPAFTSQGGLHGRAFNRTEVLWLNYRPPGMFDIGGLSAQDQIRGASGQVATQDPPQGESHAP